MNNLIVFTALSHVLQGQLPSKEDMVQISDAALKVGRLSQEVDDLTKKNEHLLEEMLKMASAMEEVEVKLKETMKVLNELEVAQDKTTQFYDFMGNLEVETPFGPASMKHVANALFTAKTLGESLAFQEARKEEEEEENLCHCPICNGDC
jgi:chaperonin cofactor prefoldin